MPRIKSQKTNFKSDNVRFSALKHMFNFMQIDENNRDILSIVKLLWGMEKRSPSPETASTSFTTSALALSVLAIV